MPRAWVPSLVAFVLAAAGIHAGADGDDSKFVVPNVPDLTIKTRETINLPQSTVQINTVYFKGAWQRRDLYLRFPSSLPAQRTVRHTAITRCDERRNLELNHEARLYAWSPLNFVGRAVYGVRSRQRERPGPPANVPERKIIINTVDTGERRQVGSYSARHVIRTITTDPSPGAATRPSESVEDGWYIDLPSADCWNAGSGHLIATVGGALERVNVEFRGGGRRGFPIEQTIRHAGEHEPSITTRVRLIEFSETVLDQSLFDVPAGYRPALPRLFGHFDMTKPDTVANRLVAYWQDATTLARGLFLF